MKYILAISGGIDSVTLLDELIRRPDRYLDDEAAEYVVAHVDHGIRDDSASDEVLVRHLAEKYNLEYRSTKLQLADSASEALARQRRYAWLRSVQQEFQATAIVTAHHQDDVIETIIINMVRGTGWRGLCSLYDQPAIRRPFIRYSKAEIVQLALQSNLAWREDSTNQSPKYLRNLIRMTLLNKLNARERKQLVNIYSDQCRLRCSIDEQLDELVDKVVVYEDPTAFQFDRYWLIMAGWPVIGEIIMHTTGHRFERTTLVRLWLFVCTARPKTEHYEDGYFFRATIRHLIVSPPHI